MESKLWGLTDSDPAEMAPNGRFANSLLSRKAHLTFRIIFHSLLIPSANNLRTLYPMHALWRGFFLEKIMGFICRGNHVISVEILPALLGQILSPGNWSDQCREGTVHYIGHINIKDEAIDPSNLYKYSVTCLPKGGLLYICTVHVYSIMCNCIMTYNVLVHVHRHLPSPDPHGHHEGGKRQ